MGVNKDIGKAYNERLKSLEASPNDSVWEKIESSLETKKKNKIFPLWFRFIGAGLGILLLSGIVYNMSIKNNTIPDSTEKNSNTPSDIKNTPIKNEDVLISDSNKNLPLKTDTNNSIQVQLSDSDSNINSDSKVKNDSNTETKNELNTNVRSTNTIVVESKINSNNNNNNNSGINNSNNNSIKPNKTNSLTNTENGSKNINVTSTKVSSNNNTSNNHSNDNTINLKNKNSDNKLTTSNETDNNSNENSSKSKSEEILNTANQINNSNLENKLDLEKKLMKDVDSTFKKDTLLVTVKKDSVLDKKLPKKKVEEKKSEWEVGAYIIPTYFGSFSKGSSLGEILEDNDKQANITLSYRILGHFKLSEKLTLRTGFGNTKLSYTTLNATSTDTNGELENLGAFPGISYDFMELSEIYDNDLLGTSSSIDFKQEITYFEIPVELIYRIPKNKIEWKVFGGASVFKLSKNKIIAESSSGNYYIGGANNLSKYSYSVNLGGGFDYKISNKVNLTVKPIFKYHINTFSRKTNFKPISAGVSFGATYKF